MRDPLMLVGFEHEKHALLLKHFLNSHQVAVEIIPQQGQYAFAVTLNNADQQQLAEQLTQQFLQNPQDKKLQQSLWQSDAPIVSSSQASIGVSFAQVLGFIQHAPVTSAVLTACVVFYLASILGGWLEVIQLLSFQPLAQLQENHQWWRLISPTLLHFSILHIVFNVLWWGMLGSKIEQRFGSLALVILYCISGVFSNYGQYIDGGVHFGGLSGVVYAVLGFVWWIGWLRPQWGLGLPKQIVGFMLVWLVLGYVDVLWVNMANTAHSVGLISGCLLAWLVSFIRPVTSSK
ncbi:rhomboid family intramembrane serine protease GlpG [Alteromonadaceae bacterium BrNp21-10]|nr:rhomboid family intramembrane serine protease GlpG [Alteromonadaceae bacterium BrNp21-10]